MPRKQRPAPKGAEYDPQIHAAGAAAARLHAAAEAVAATSGKDFDILTLLADRATTLANALWALEGRGPGHNDVLHDQFQEDDSHYGPLYYDLFVVPVLSVAVRFLSEGQTPDPEKPIPAGGFAWEWCRDVAADVSKKVCAWARVHGVDPEVANAGA